MGIDTAQVKTTGETLSGPVRPAAPLASCDGPLARDGAEIEPVIAGCLGRLARLTRKELSESLRDRRTIFTLVLMPVLLYPLLAIAFQQMLLSSKVAEAQPISDGWGVARQK